MDKWLAELADDLDRLGQAASRRSLRQIDAPPDAVINLAGRRLINLASNDYLALSRHPHVVEAAATATRTWGAGAGASRLVSGHQLPHAQLEKAFASFKHAEAALLCPTGYMANLAVVTSLAGPGDVILQDKLNHASLIDAARLSGAAVRTYPHRNLDKLERLLQRSLAQAYDATSPPASSTSTQARDQDDDDPPGQRLRMARRLIVTDAVFSMDGDAADLPALCALADKYDAILIVDEAHATGILGPTGAGLCELQGVSDRVDVVVSTASKALGSLGGIVTSNQIVIDTLINRARSFIYTTAAPPAQPAAIAAALDVVRDEPSRRERLRAIIQHVRTRLADAGVIETGDRSQPSNASETHADAEQADRAQPPTASEAHADAEQAQRREASGTSGTYDTLNPLMPIVPIIAGSAAAAIDLSKRLEAAGYFAPAIRPPTVAPGSARVRLALRADLTDAHVDGLIDALIKWHQTRTS